MQDSDQEQVAAPAVAARIESAPPKEDRLSGMFKAAFFPISAAIGYFVASISARGEANRIAVQDGTLSDVVKAHQGRVWSMRDISGSKVLRLKKPWGWRPRVVGFTAQRWMKR